MKKTITALILGIVLISCVSSINLTAGETYSFPSEEFEFWTVTGNSSDMSGMNISWENGNTSVSFDSLFKSDSFTLLLFNQDTEVIVEHHYSGGGSSRRRVEYVDKNTTIYLPTECNETQGNQTISPDIILEPLIEKESFFTKLIEWLKSLLRRIIL